MPRKRHVSRNPTTQRAKKDTRVMPRKRHVSRNVPLLQVYAEKLVMPRKRHVSRNANNSWVFVTPMFRHASQEACE